MGGTFEISSNPTKEARTKIKRLKIRSSIFELCIEKYSKIEVYAEQRSSASIFLQKET